MTRSDLAEQPLQARQMLLVVAAQVMDEPADRHGPVAFEDGRTIEL